MVSRAIVGAILDVPALREHEDIRKALATLEGSSCLIVASPGDPCACAVGEYAAWVRARIGDPVHSDPQHAHAEILANAEKLERRKSRKAGEP